jgi:endonuclease/exonuclease/phosphatase family metal-dependent hydrolase
LYPDIIGLQEFLVRYRGEELRIRNLPHVADEFDSLGFQSVGSEVHDVSTTLQPILSRSSKLVQKEQRRLVVQEAGYPEMGVMRMKFNWKGRDAVYYNLHLRTFGEKKPWLETTMSPMSLEYWLFYIRQYRDAFLYRAWQADKIRGLVEQETLPLIVAGDFNSTPHNWEFHRLATGLQDVFEVVGNKREVSYHARFPLARIDHMLVSNHWNVYRAEIPALEYSDHRPLLVLLGLKAE